MVNVMGHLPMTVLFDYAHQMLGLEACLTIYRDRVDNIFITDFIYLCAGWFSNLNTFYFALFIIGINKLYICWFNLLLLALLWLLMVYSFLV